MILARACCDNIEELAPFRSDPRPTWLFLSSGIPTALLRGANRWGHHPWLVLLCVSRPLLSKLFNSELGMERGARLPVFIDYKSSCVIQCVGQLSSLAQDRVVHSIGQYDTIQYHVSVFHSTVCSFHTVFILYCMKSLSVYLLYHSYSLNVIVKFAWCYTISCICPSLHSFIDRLCSFHTVFTVFPQVF